MTELTYKLDDFEGPLDLLLHLISKNKLNIYDIPLFELVEQYMAYINSVKERDMDVASDFLEMAARLVYMKTVSLLPKHDEVEQLKDELTGELLEYQICQQIAAKLSKMTDGFDTYVRKPTEIEPDKTYEISHPAESLLEAYIAAVGRGQRKLPPPTTSFERIVARKIVSVSSKIIYILRSIWHGGKKKFNTLFEGSKSRSEIVATFLAVLELMKANRVNVDGTGDDSEIMVVGERKRK